MNWKSAALAFGLSLAMAGTSQAQLLAHRAVYELKLLRANGSGGPADARGLIAYDFSGSQCEGYTTNFRQMMELAGEDGSVHVSEVRTTTFEDAAYNNFQFRASTLNDGKPGDAVDGKALRDPSGGVSVNLAKPDTKKLSFPKDIFFPTQHVVAIINAARAGETTLAHQVYDGSDNGEKLFDTLTVIGKAMTDVPAGFAGQQAELKNVRRWPVTISYFETGRAHEQPSYVVSFDLYENGVSRDLKLDYGDFVLQGEMRKFEATPAKACAK